MKRKCGKRLKLTSWKAYALRKIFLFSSKKSKQVILILIWLTFHVVYFRNDSTQTASEIPCKECSVILQYEKNRRKQSKELSYKVITKTKYDFMNFCSKKKTNKCTCKCRILTHILIYTFFVSGFWYWNKCQSHLDKHKLKWPYVLAILQVQVH